MALQDKPLTCDERVVWQDIELDVPRSWEMLRQGLRFDRGLSVFWDRSEERLQLAWQREAAAPDFGRLLSDLKARELAAHAANPDETPKPEWIPLPVLRPWHGVVIRQGDRLTTRAACYVPDMRTMIEVGICWGTDRRPDLEAGLLSGIRALPPQAIRTWRAMGLHAQVPAELPLTACHPLPGGVVWVFQDRQGRRMASVERLAFPGIRLQASLSDWLLQQRPPRFKADGRSFATSRSPHPFEVAASTCWFSHHPAAWRVRRCDAACVCPAEARVYHWWSQASRGPLPEVAVACACGPLPGLPRPRVF
jgi:hypothetical protein